MARRILIEKIGILDESYFIYDEDSDWCVRAARAGYRLMYEPRAKIWHKLSVATGGISPGSRTGTNSRATAPDGEACKAISLADYSCTVSFDSNNMLPKISAKVSISV